MDHKLPMYGLVNLVFNLKISVVSNLIKRVTKGSCPKDDEKKGCRFEMDVSHISAIEAARLQGNHHVLQRE